MGERKGEPADGLSGETHCAPSSLRSNSRRKFEFLYGSTPVLQLACGVAQALRLELPLPQAGEGTSSRIEKDFSSSAADINGHQRHIQKREPNQPLTPIQQALPAIKIEKNFSRAGRPCAGGLLLHCPSGRGQEIRRLVRIAAAADAQLQPRFHVLAHFGAVAHLRQVFPVQ